MQKDYFSFPNSFTNILLEIRSSIINQVWIGLVIFILPITLYDIYLFWDGFNIQFFYKLIQAVIIIVISIWRNSFNISFKVGVFLTLLYFLIVSGFYRFGFYSSAGIFIVVFVAIAFLFLRFKLFVLTVLIISFSYIFLASLFVKGVITLDYTRAYFSYSHLNWIVDLLIIFFISYVSVFSMFKFFNAYKIELMNHINTEEKIKHTLEYLPVPVATFNKNR
ncbi:hypothetical protein [Carboxylicivirga caseinilyticus]|uniref:hypothetical protein n=1 Tax=Carboxylicivirga caseinilyticus TaxID=3417572 RepID=UPI003D346A14|nr:hypothetical protein [Marinilabiliaceae bacterium A049]